jgi:hypothetical protein
MIIHRISNLADEELLRLSNDVADAFQLSSVMEDGPPPQLFLSLLALCNHERVVRTLRPRPRHASHPVTAAARKRLGRPRPASTRGKTSGLSSH